VQVIILLLEKMIVLVIGQLMKKVSLALNEFTYGSEQTEQVEDILINEGE